MKALIIKGAIGTVGVSGLAVGGYYGVQAINSKSASKTDSKKEQKVDTPWEAFEKTHEMFGEDQWQTKYDEFRKNNYDAFSNALKKGSGKTIVVKKDGEADTGGGANLKSWCQALFRLKQNVENAKAYCAKPKTNQETLSRPT